MQLQTAECRQFPAEESVDRLIALILQEWAWFGFPEYQERSSEPPAPGEERIRRPRVSEAEAARIATTIAGYWAATPGGSWILGRQNEQWEGPDGIGARWRDAWSAAFISWAMCESGVSSAADFKRSIAHHSYIDQAIVALEDPDARSAYRAYDIGQMQIRPGDMLCTGSRPEYANLAARMAQLGEGARTHCDIVVGLDAHTDQLLTIGGNVQSLVRLKRMDWADREAGIPLDPGGSPFFAHLSIQLPTGELKPVQDHWMLQALASD